MKFVALIAFVLASIPAFTRISDILESYMKWPIACVVTVLIQMIMFWAFWFLW